MAKKIKVITYLAIALIIICASAAIAVVNEKSVDAVKNVAMSENTSSSIKVDWNKVKGADGYHLYLMNDENEEGEKIGDVDGGEICSYSFEDIDGGTVYKIKVTAYKVFNKKEYESEEAQTVTVYSLPEVPDVSAYSPYEGALTAQWTQQKNSAGYELQYSKDEDFSGAEKESLEKSSFEIENLKPKDIYYVRARSFITAGIKNVYSDWCLPCRVEIKERVIMNPDLDPDKPIVALSFDDGPAFNYENKNSTMEILKVLEEHGARATFFMCGSRINDENKVCLEKKIELGCELGNHTYDHKNYGKKVTENDIKKCSDAIKKASGHYPTVFRCPGGVITAEMQKECVRESMPIAYWSVETEDWKSKDADKIYKAVMDNVYDGSIILLHDIYPSTADAVKRIVPKLIEDGYQVVGVSEMLTAKNGGEPPEPGQQYVDYNTINNNTK